MNLSMYNNVYMNRQNKEDEESIIPKKQISIIKSTHSNTRNSNNYNENSTLNIHKMTSTCNVNKDANYKRYTSKDKKIIIPTKVLVQQMIINSKRMLQFTSRIKENLSKPKNSIPLHAQPQKVYMKQNVDRNKVKSIDFDQIGLYKRGETKSRNHYSQRDHNSSNINNSFLKGSSVEKQSIKKTIDFISRNKMCPASSMNQKVTSTSKNRRCSENSNYDEVTINNGSRNYNIKKNNHNTLVHSNYAQKYLQKIIRNSFDINKRVRSTNKHHPCK